MVLGTYEPGMCSTSTPFRFRISRTLIVTPQRHDILPACTQNHCRLVQPLLLRHHRFPRNPPRSKGESLPARTTSSLDALARKAKHDRARGGHVAVHNIVDGGGNRQRARDVHRVPTRRASRSSHRDMTIDGDDECRRQEEPSPCQSKTGANKRRSSHIVFFQISTGI